MTPTACARLFEAEAMRDGRLVGVALHNFERHVRVCAVCACEVQALEALAEPLRADSPSRSPSDELHARRERSRLLATFAGARVAPERHRHAGYLPLWAAAVAALAGGVFVVRHEPPSAPRVHAASAVVSAQPATLWSRHMQGNRETVVLERGVLFIHVEHHAPEQNRLLVVLPDGELEDTGTTFTVNVQDKRTTHVAVQEGSVVLRIRGQAPVSIAAGHAWVPQTGSAQQACPSAITPVEAAANESRASAAPAAARQRAHGPRAVAPDPAHDFRSAMAVFQLGRQREAAAAFTRFVAQYPGDPRAEDAAYLRIIAFQKCGAESDMLWAAQRYLERYPTGLRHAEVARLSGVP